MLDRIGGILLRSTESLAEEELGLGVAPEFIADRRWYFPAIVTNASLHVCFYDPAEVDLESGELPEGQFEPMEFVRFRKGLSTGRPLRENVPDLRTSNREKERTVFIIEGGHFRDVLRGWNLG